MTGEELPGGAARSLVLTRGRRLRLEALGDDVNVTLLAFAAADHGERLNVPDTLKAQLQARVRAPMVLMSHAGRALLSMTGSSLDWHDALTGHGTDADVARYGPSSYALHRNDWRRSARALLLDELASHGLGERDLHAGVNLFTKVAIADDDRASLRWVGGHARAGDWVELRADVDVLVVLCTAPHPMDDRPSWAPAGVRLQVAAGEPAGPDDASVHFRAESARALEQARSA